MTNSSQLITAATHLRDAVDSLTFSPPVTHRGASRSSAQRIGVSLTESLPLWRREKCPRDSAREPGSLLVVDLPGSVAEKRPAKGLAGALCPPPERFGAQSDRKLMPMR